MCPKTSAYLQVRSRAFEEVEKLLAGLLGNFAPKFEAASSSGSKSVEAGGCDQSTNSS